MVEGEGQNVSFPPGTRDSHLSRGEIAYRQRLIVTGDAGDLVHWLSCSLAVGPGRVAFSQICVSPA